MSDAIDSPLNSDSEAVLRSWRDNALAWTDAVRLQKIQSRTLVTNQAIIDAIVTRKPGNVLDLGCGEGWLSRQLATLGIQVTGVDAVAALVDAARTASEPGVTTPEFHQLDYQQIVSGALQQRFDLIVSNFSLLDKEGVAAMLRYIPALLNVGGHFLIQTLHPEYNGTQHDGWREESWSGIGDNFSGGARWYYRTLASWHYLFAESGLQLLESQEPVHPHTGLPASIIFCLAAQ